MMITQALRAKVDALSAVLINDPNMTNPINQHAQKIREALAEAVNVCDQLDRRQDDFQKKLDELNRKVSR